jgi:hypothetical protein
LRRDAQLEKLRHICFASGAILHKVVRFITKRL